METIPPSSDEKRHFQRFDGFTRFLHVLVILSFLSLAITGMTIKFSDAPVFQTMSKLMGGSEVTGYVHRYAAVVTFLYFFLHIGYLVKKKRRRNIRWRQILTGEDSLSVNKTDFVEIGGTIKWFLGIGPRPRYGRWTYWEKFDYFAVFWGVFIIGSSGLLLWFPEFFTSLGIPGYVINISTIIHSDEALLATGFIFTVHFFNTHFRPDRFPMDPVIFTGSVTEEELKADRPRYYEYLVETGKLEELLVDAPHPMLERWARIFGLSALTIGLVTVILIIYTIFLYI
ncbi:formate dehydrogenase subunit gamma [Bacteroidota bacterium]